MAEVGAGQIEEVDNDQQERNPEVTANKQVDEAECEQTVSDEVATNICGGSHVYAILMVEVPAISTLKYE